MKMKASFPKLKGAARTGKIGVDTVSSIVNDQLQWLFRRNPGEDDFGIDGYIDIVLEDGSITGQSIAIQIKCGNSFFVNKSSVGFVFYGEKKHLNYYLNSQIPVLIILCDPETKHCYWEVFNALKTEKTGSGWKMTIPSSQLLNNTSKHKLLDIVGPAADQTKELEHHWALAEELRSAERVHYAVDRSDIESLHIEPVCEFFSRLQVNLDICEKLQGKVVLSISGYDNDERELYEIPEVRAWFVLAYPAVKYWFYFLTTDPSMSSLIVLFACVCETEKIGQKSHGVLQIGLELTKLHEMLMNGFGWLNEMTERLGMSDDKNESISRAISEVVGFPSSK
jgi:hypothetical protein